MTNSILWWGFGFGVCSTHVSWIGNDYYLSYLVMTLCQRSVTYCSIFFYDGIISIISLSHHTRIIRLQS